MALENVFPAIPSEAVLPLDGFVAGRGDANLIGMILAATAASAVGAWILYGIAAAVGPARLRGFIVRLGRWLGVREISAGAVLGGRWERVGAVVGLVQGAA